jgi:hypothetical protein
LDEVGAVVPRAPDQKMMASTAAKARTDPHDARQRRSRARILSAVAVNTGGDRALFFDPAATEERHSSPDVGWQRASCSDLVRFLWTRSLDPVSLAAAIGFSLAVLVSGSFGGDSLPLKLRGAVLWGLAGLTCFGSVALRRPLPLAQIVLPRNLRASYKIPKLRRVSATTNLILGLTLIARAATHAALALTLASGAYLVASQLTGWCILLIGVGFFIGYMGRLRRSVMTEKRGGE